MVGIKILNNFYLLLLDTVYHKQKSILIVEDDLELARLYRKYLESQGLDVTCFLNPYDALENFKIDINFYDLVLTDFRLNDMNGIKFAKEIRKIRGYSIFIVLMTGYFMDSTLRENEMVGVINKVIVKPFSLNDLGKIIDHYMNLSMVYPSFSSLQNFDKFV